MFAVDELGDLLPQVRISPPAVILSNEDVSETPLVLRLVGANFEVTDISLCDLDSLLEIKFLHRPAHVVVQYPSNNLATLSHHF